MKKFKKVAQFLNPLGKIPRTSHIFNSRIELNPPIHKKADENITIRITFNGEREKPHYNVKKEAKLNGEKINN